VPDQAFALHFAGDFKEKIPQYLTLRQRLDDEYWSKVQVRGYCKLESRQAWNRPRKTLGGSDARGAADQPADPAGVDLAGGCGQ
jgi:hypothetical protein